MTRYLALYKYIGVKQIEYIVNYRLEVKASNSSQDKNSSKEIEFLMRVYSKTERIINRVIFDGFDKKKRTLGNRSKLQRK